MYPTTALQPGSTNTTAVKQLQDYLVSQGFMTRAQVNTGYGTYGPQTTAAVLAYQKAKGIDYSSGPGYWGPKTIAAAGSTSTSSTSTVPKTTTTSSTQNYTPYVAPTNQSVYTPPPTQSVYVPPSPQPTAPTSGGLTSGYYKPLDKSLLTTVTSNLGPGLQNDPNQVRALQSALVAAGYMTQAQMNTGPGIYGPQTTAAVATWQKQNGIPTSGNDGFFGPVSKNFISTGTKPDPNAPIINPSVPRADNPAITDPYNIPPGILPDGVANSGITSLPDEAVRMMVPQLKPGTPEYQAAMDKINTAYFDVLQQQMNAKTEQEQRVANTNWQTLKKNIETNLNVTLSNDAFQAWDQVQGLKSQFNQQGLQGSGMQAEATDAYLRKIRQADSVARTGAKNDQEKGQMDYYLKFATPQQIAALVASNPEQAKAWGLMPSDDVRNAMSLSALRSKYPGVPDKDLQAYIATVIDENGNYRSNLYQNYMTGSSPGATPGTEQRKYDPVTGKVIGYTVTPSDLGVADINAARAQFQAGTLQNQNDAATADYNYQLNSNANSVKSSAPSTDTVSGTSAGTRFNSVTPNNYTPPTTTYKAPTYTAPSTTYTAPKPTTTTTTTVKPPTTTTTAPTYNTYTIRSGDTLSALAARYGTTVTKLAALNNISDPNKIYAGATLKY